MNKILSRIITFVVIFITLVLFALSRFVLVVKAQSEASSSAMVSFTFDDGFASTYQYALPILSERSIPATIYISSGLIGGTYDGQTMMTWQEVESLQNDYGWEIGGHTVSHPELPLLTQEEIIAELTNSKTTLESHGLTVLNFATPYGAYNNSVLTQILKYYDSHRGFADRDGLNTFPYNKGILMIQSVEEGVTPAIVQGWVNEAIAQNRWLILVFHMGGPVANQYEYNVSVVDFTTIADYIKNSGIKIVRVDKALKIPGVSVLTNSDFASGNSGWTTDRATQVLLDSNNSGAYGDPQNSIKLTGATESGHLFADLVDANFEANYLLEAFYNTIGLTQGELGFYIDEYDRFGNWISGQWIGKVANNAVGYFTKLYKVTSNLVKKLGVQIYLTAGSNGTAYIDNVNLHNLDAATPTPTPEPSGSPSPTPTPTPTPIPGPNMIANSSFEEEGLAHWSTDNTNYVTVDSNTNGSLPYPLNSIKFNSGNSGNVHLFGEKIPVSYGHQYDLSIFVNANSLLAGEIGFYMDEYDVNGNWISGQWFGLVAPGQIKQYSRVYTPISAAVNQISIQTYLSSLSQGTVYADNYSLNDESSPTPTPTPTESVTPTPSPVPEVNLVVNPSFEQVDGTGWAQNWIRQTIDWVIDTLFTHDGAHSVKLTGTSRTHLFSDHILIDPTKIYTWSQYVKAETVGSEFGFYIDEYDAADNWISGQWKGMVSSPQEGVINITYTPTGANVERIGLQYYYVGGGTDSLIYIDSVKLITN